MGKTRSRRRTKVSQSVHDASGSGKRRRNVDSVKFTLNRRARMETSHNSPYRCTLEAFVKLVSKLRDKLTDDHVEALKLFKSQSWYNYTHLIIPLNTPRRLLQSAEPCHWTLLVLNTSDSIWLHYNSMLPKGNDGHYDNALVVKEYVENAMEIVMAEEKNVDRSTIDLKHNIQNVKDAAQQQYNSLDCGVFICILMERLMKNTKMTANVNKDLVHKYRGQMAKTFIEEGLKKS